MSVRNSVRAINDDLYVRESRFAEFLEQIDKNRQTGKRRQSRKKLDCNKLP